MDQGVVVRFAFAVLILGAESLGPTFAYDVIGVQANAIGLPELNVILRETSTTAPYSGFDDIDDPFTNLRMVLDTGASGVVLFENQTAKLAIPLATSGGSNIEFFDVGVGGTTQFNVSVPLHIRLGQFDTAVPATYDPAMEATSYPRQYTDVRLQLGPPGSGFGALGLGFLGPFDLSGIAGMPLLEDHVVVMQPRFGETLGDTIRTYVYDPNVTPSAGPGIPTSNFKISLFMKDFSRFTSVSPVGSDTPSLTTNPFIGPDPLAEFEGQNPLPNSPPGVVLTFNGNHSVQSLLLDTGNQTSSISTNVATMLGVRYQAGTENTATPILETFDNENPDALGLPLANQFTATLSGIAGTEVIAGFFLDNLQLKSRLGDAQDDSDPNHLNFVGAPVYVQDITLQDPQTNETFTIAGIIGMNYLMASFSGQFGGGFVTGPFETVVLDFVADSSGINTLGLYAAGFTPQPSANTHTVPLPLLAQLLGLTLFAAIGCQAHRNNSGDPI